MGLLRRLIGLQVRAHVPRPQGVLGARDAGGPRLHQEPSRRLAAADPRGHHVPHGGPGDPLAVRLHPDRHPRRHERRRPRRAPGARHQDGQQERLHAQAIEQPVRHRRRRDRLRLRPPPDLHVHVRDVPEPCAGQLDRSLLPARRADRAADRPQQGRHLLPDGVGRLPLRARRQAHDPLWGATTRTSRSRAAGRRTRSARTRSAAAPGSGAIRRRPRIRPGPSGRDPWRWSPVRRPGHPRTRTTSTADRPRSARPRSSCRRPWATSCSATTWPMPRTRRPRTCSARMSRPRTGRERSSARNAAPRTRTRRRGPSPRSR